MVSLKSQKHFRSVQRLSFCYLCGNTFEAGDNTNRDHVPPKGMFTKSDREPLVLRTHAACNKSFEALDEKSGQLFAMRRLETTSVNSRRLQFTLSPNMQHGAVANIDIEGAIWRWIKGFHAALYREPLIYCGAPSTSGKPYARAIITPFPRAQMIDGAVIIEPLLSQHQHFVQTIKTNRVKGNLDQISCNKGKLTYECVWVQADNSGPWLCVFALDIYDWKDLGRTRLQPARGCAGFYIVSSNDTPACAARGMDSSIIIPNYDRLDPFAP
jgi:hypothetical protein